MKKSEMIALIKKFGKTAYIAKKEFPLVSKWDPVKEELSYNFVDCSLESVFNQPLSLIGGVSHSQHGEAWPYHQNRPFIPLLQITALDLPIFSELFDSETKVISIFCPENPVRYLEENRWGIEIKEYKHPEKLTPLTIPKHILHELEIYTIAWEKIIDYPQEAYFDLFFPEILSDSILSELAEECGKEYYQEFFPTLEGTKMGGYPYCIQREPSPWDSEILSSDPNKDPASWKFIMQIDGKDFKKSSFVADSGMMSLFQNIHTKEWFCDVQKIGV